MARPQLPDKLHALKGTEAAPRDKVIPLAMHGGRPVCPKHLSKAARREWLAAVRLMETRCTLDPGAGPTLLIYATTMARWLEAKADVEARGMMITVQKSTSKGDLYEVEVENPMLAIQVDAEAQLMQLTKTLGIAPDSREKVQKVKAVARASAIPLWAQKAQEEAAKEQADGKQSDTDGS